MTVLAFRPRLDSLRLSPPISVKRPSGVGRGHIDPVLTMLSLEVTVTSWAGATVGLLTLLVALRYASSRRLDPREPVVLPPAIPFVGHVVGMALFGGRYIKRLGYVVLRPFRPTYGSLRMTDMSSSASPTRTSPYSHCRSPARASTSSRSPPWRRPCNATSDLCPSRRWYLA